jgi:hypothetical protein
MQPFEMAFMAVIVFGVLAVMALANGRWKLAVFFFALTVIAWGTHLSLVATP